MRSLCAVVEGGGPMLSRHGPSAETIPEVFLKYASLITNYYRLVLRDLSVTAHRPTRDYMAHYDGMIQTLETLRKNKKFVAFLVSVIDWHIM